MCVGVGHQRPLYMCADAGITFVKQSSQREGKLIFEILRKHKYPFLPTLGHTSAYQAQLLQRKQTLSK